MDHRRARSIHKSDGTYRTYLDFFLFFVFHHHFYFPAQLVVDFTLSDLLDKPWSQVSSLLPPGSCLQFLSRIGYSAFPLLVDFFHRMLPTHALALSANHFFMQEKVPTSMCTRLGENWTREIDFSVHEDNLSHRGRRLPTIYRYELLILLTCPPSLPGTGTRYVRTWYLLSAIHVDDTVIRVTGSVTNILDSPSNAAVNQTTKIQIRSHTYPQPHI